MLGDSDDVGGMWGGGDLGLKQQRRRCSSDQQQQEEEDKDEDDEGEEQGEGSDGVNDELVDELGVNIEGYPFFATIGEWVSG